MKNCKDCRYYDANKGGIVPLCLKFPRPEMGKGWFFSCIASRALDDLCGQDGRYFEPVQLSELRQAQMDCVIQHFLD